MRHSQLTHYDNHISEFDEWEPGEIDELAREVVAGSSGHDTTAFTPGPEFDGVFESSVGTRAAQDTARLPAEVRYMRCKILKINIRALAEKIGVRPLSIRRWEDGTSRPSPAHYSKLRRVAFNRMKERAA